jgi:hypothetical protein
LERFVGEVALAIDERKQVNYALDANYRLIANPAHSHLSVPASPGHRCDRGLPSKAGRGVSPDRRGIR